MTESETMDLVYSRPVTEIIRSRTSRRLYKAEKISPDDKVSINTFIQTDCKGPFGSKTRARLITATDEDNKALNNLGTYGFIGNPAGYVVGAVNDGPHDLEDIGYVLEKTVLKLTDMGLDSCWVGATFTANEFSKKIDATHGEKTPAVISVGYATDRQGSFERLVRWGARSRKRLPWQDIFFHSDFKTPLSEDDAGSFATALEMVRLGPSASNRQPWRFIMADDHQWHLYLRRTGFYRNLMRTLNRADIQRLDMGIAMFHFEATCMEAGIEGQWAVDEPTQIKELPADTEYVATFRADQKR